MALGPDPDQTLVIREMRDTDRDVVIALLWELNRYEAELDLREQPFAQDRDTSHAAAIACFDRDCERAAEQEGALIVAERDGAVLGFLCWLVEMAEPFVRPRMRAYGYVADLVVASGHRGAGIGTRLLAEAERLTRARRLNRLAIGVLLGNDGAARAYERFGFRSHSTELFKALD
jgi:ribosomal protein S18 acetylase RimI-like enzyme